jgi:hypothetical protein
MEPAKRVDRGPWAGDSFCARRSLLQTLLVTVGGGETLGLLPG